MNKGKELNSNYIIVTDKYSTIDMLWNLRLLQHWKTWKFKTSRLIEIYDEVLNIHDQG